METGLLLPPRLDVHVEAPVVARKLLALPQRAQQLAVQVEDAHQPVERRREHRRRLADELQRVDRVGVRAPRARELDGRRGNLGRIRKKESAIRVWRA